MTAEAPRSPRAVLGIDAAWTLTQPSGVALAVETETGWRMVAAEPSYEHFFALADPIVALPTRPTGSTPNAEKLIRTAEQLAEATVVVVAIDMPMSRYPIVARRTADNEVSKAYGARKCSTHTPSGIRPGAISDELRAGFESVGFPLRTMHFDEPALIEVYPHPALVELTGAPERLPYKVSKTRAYWKQLSPNERKSRLILQWISIVEALGTRIQGVADRVAPAHPYSSGFELKAAEDVIDAMVCAWVAIEALARSCKAYGDGEAAIWIPSGIIELQECI